MSPAALLEDPRFQFVDGSPGLTFLEAKHVLILGRGRDPSGEALTDSSIARALFGGELFTKLDLEERGGVIIPCGNRTPGENFGKGHGRPWSPPDDPDKIFVGYPEADMISWLLLAMRIGKQAIKIERNSIDTITNLTEAERGGYFPDDDEPVILVGHEEHLYRALKIGKKVLKRDFVGAVVPELGEKEHDPLLARAFSGIALLRVSKDRENIDEQMMWRVSHLWQAANVLRKLFGVNSLALYSESPTDGDAAAKAT